MYVLARVCTVTRFLHRHICNFWHFMFYLYHHHFVLHEVHVRVGLLLYNCCGPYLTTFHAYCHFSHACSPLYVFSICSIVRYVYF
jgi:hypothetical protein